MEKLSTLPKQDHEKRQLAEIAHLYFSTPAPDSRAPERADRRNRRVETFSPFARTLVVRCVAAQQDQGIVTWYLFNLAVMLKILDGPVLVIGSERFCERRYLFGFRPDRERLLTHEGPRSPSGSLGPMGVCLLDGRLLWKAAGEEEGMYSAGPLAGTKASFRYILSDEGRAGLPFRSLPGLTVFLVTPSTTTPALLERASGGDQEPSAAPVHAGLVTAGAGSAEEAGALYVYWRNRLVETGEADPDVADLGVVPPEALASSPAPAPCRGDGLVGSHRAPFYGPLGQIEPFGVGVFEQPLGPVTAFLRSAAASIRTKRSELLRGRR
jgi:hypothetical protein